MKRYRPLAAAGRAGWCPQQGSTQTIPPGECGPAVGQLVIEGKVFDCRPPQRAVMCQLPTGQVCGYLLLVYGSRAKRKRSVNPSFYRTRPRAELVGEVGEEHHLGGVGDESPVLVPERALSGRPSIVCPAGAVVGQEPFGAQRLEEVHGQIRARREPRRTLVPQTLGDASGHPVRQGENAEGVDRTVRQLRRAVEPQPCGHVGSSGLVLLPRRVAKGRASLDARPERKRLKRLDPRWRWFSVGAARQRRRHFGGYGVDERRTPPRRAEHRNDTGTRRSPLVADRGLDLSGRAAPAQHADVYVERTGSDLTGEHGRTGTQELSWVVDYHIFLEASHGTELARYGSPWASEIGITPQRGICTNPPTPNLWLCQCQVAPLIFPGRARHRLS